MVGAHLTSFHCIYLRQISDLFKFEAIHPSICVRSFGDIFQDLVLSDYADVSLILMSHRAHKLCGPWRELSHTVCTVARARGADSNFG